MCVNTGCNSCSDNCGCSCNSCCNNDCNNCNEQPCGCPFEVDFACVRFNNTNLTLDCIDLVEGDTLESWVKKLNQVICDISTAEDGDSAYDVWINNGNTGTEQDFLDSLVGEDGPYGLSGRGVAVFVQTLEPTQTDFDTAYGTVEGFGVNGISGSNQIKAGDIWIENCA